jgi:hypothetical protein
VATLRASRLQYCNNASSVAIALPTGSAAGDLCFLFGGHGFAVSTPSGWTPLTVSSGSNYNGAVFRRVLSSADITAGSITVSFGGTYYGHVALATMVGNGSWDIFFADSRNSTGATSRSQATPNSINSGSLALWFSGGRANITITCNRGGQLQTDSQLNASATLYSESVGSTAVDTATFTYSSAPTGDYEAVVVIQDIPPGLQVTKAEMGAWLSPPDGLDVPKAALAAWLDLHDLQFSKVSLAAWIELNDFRVPKGELLAWLDATADDHRRMSLM